MMSKYHLTILYPTSGPGCYQTKDVFVTARTMSIQSSGSIVFFGAENEIKAVYPGMFTIITKIVNIENV